MAFVLSKLLLFALQPFYWVLMLVAAALICRPVKLKRRLFAAAMAVGLLFSNPFLLRCVSAWWDYPRPTLKPDKTYNCAIVLGGFVSEDAQGNGFFNGAADRFIQGLRLQAGGRVTHLLITGGNASLTPNHFSEGNWAGDELKLLHVPDTAILIESRARNTIENAAYAKQLLLKRQLPPPYLLVTSAFHMRRALAVFKREHIPVVPYACNFSGGEGKLSVNDFFPDAGALNGWTLYFKEMAGLWMLKL